MSLAPFCLKQDMEDAVKLKPPKSVDDLIRKAYDQMAKIEVDQDWEPTTVKHPRAGYGETKSDRSLCSICHKGYHDPKSCWSRPNASPEEKQKLKTLLERVDRKKKKGAMFVMKLRLTKTQAATTVPYAPRRGQQDSALRLRICMITESDSPYASPVVLAKKRTGDYRMCADYSAINAIMKPLPFPLPNTEELLSHFKEMKFFAAIDLRSGFNQVLVEESSQRYTAFVVPGGLYECKRMPFGIKTTPSHFQKEMTTAFHDLIPDVCQIYIDDIICAGRTKEELIRKVDKVLCRLSELDLRAKAEKSCIGVEQIKGTLAKSDVDDFIKAVDKVFASQPIETVLGKLRCLKISESERYLKPLKRRTRGVWDEAKTKKGIVKKGSSVSVRPQGMQREDKSIQEPVILVDIKGERLSALADTGTSHCMISEDVFGRFNEEEKLWPMPLANDVVLSYTFLRDIGLIHMNWYAEIVEESGIEIPNVEDFILDESSGVEIPVESVNEELDSTTRNKWMEMLSEFKETLDEAGEAAKVIMIDINLEGDIQCFPPRRVRPDLVEKVRAEIEKLRRKGFIKPSMSPVVSPMVIVPKKNGRIRLCIDYRRVNDVTKSLEFPLPRIEEIFRDATGHKWFKTLDLSSGYHQYLVHPDSRFATAFSTPWGIYEWIRLPFGLKCAPAFFQMVMSNLLEDLQEICRCYIDDIIIWGNTQEELQENTTKVLEKLREFRLKINPNKCKFGMKQVEHLGVILDEKGIRISPKRLLQVERFSDLETVKDVRSFLGIVNFFRKFIPSFTEMVEPIAKLKKEAEWKWGEEQCQAVMKIIKEINIQTVLSFPTGCGVIHLYTDASVSGVGGILLEEVEGEDPKVLGFMSKSLSEVQSRWSITELELFAIVYCVDQMQQYLRGREFVVHSDHRNLLYMEESQSKKVQRWKMVLSEYDFKLHHIAGKQNVVVDVLSRVRGSGRLPTQTLFTTRLVTSRDRLVKRILGEQQKETDAWKRKYKIQETQDGWTKNGALVVPEVLEHDALAMVHGEELISHAGINRMVQRLKEHNLYIPNAQQKAGSFIKNCHICQKLRMSESMRVIARDTYAIRPFAVVSVDTVGPIKPSRREFRYLVVMMDIFSSWTEIAPTLSVTAQDAARAMIDKVFCTIGLPLTIRSDNGPQYVNGLFRWLYKWLKIKHHKVITYNPQSNGIVERRNAEVVRCLRVLCAEFEDFEDWDLYLPVVQWIINTTPTSNINEWVKVQAKRKEWLVKEVEKAQKKATEERRGEEDDDQEFPELHSFVLVKPEKKPSKLHPRLLGPVEVIKLLKDRNAVEVKWLVIKQKQQEVISLRRIAKRKEWLVKEVEKAQKKATEERRGEEDDDQEFPELHSFVLVKPEKKPSKLHPRLLGPVEVIKLLKDRNAVEVKWLVIKQKQQEVISLRRIVRFRSEGYSLPSLRKLAELDEEAFVVEKVRPSFR
ncbi:Transposon Ty3-I Gag-Pol polyprotein [Aduncisulcus paluster]|uniref:Transposon Ty3-I Gag-Pol polyprotein n=1 Tax=Aduncisulcus paluster TaxID=2918883 RepID=A0ABQ5KBL9_9EUKA|nr:Transposon Ty3-I Gag-Pol polyprotein [Aduncisulcus paluster]